MGTDGYLSPMTNTARRLVLTFVTNGYRFRVFERSHRVSEANMVFAEIRSCFCRIPFGVHSVYYCTPDPRIRRDDLLRTSDPELCANLLVE